MHGWGRNLESPYDNSIMKRPKGWILLLAVALVVFGASAAWWTGFVYSENCHDAGGTIRDGVCVGSRFPVPWLWEAPWHWIAFSLVPPAVVAAIVVVGLWIARQSEKGGDD
jgi:hypothetical protein